MLHWDKHLPEEDLEAVLEIFVGNYERLISVLGRRVIQFECWFVSRVLET